MKNIDPNDPSQVNLLAQQMLYVDPRISLFLMKYPTLPKDFLMVFNFNEGTKGKSNEQLMETKSRCDFLVLGLEYTWRRPLFQRDSDFRFTEEVAALTLPYMSMFLQIDGCPQYALTDLVEPLELVARCTAVQGNYDKFRPFVLFDTDTLKGRMLLDRNFEDLTESEPLAVYLVAHGLLMQCNHFDDMTVDEACSELHTKFNIHVRKHLLDPEFLEFSLTEEEERLVSDPRNKRKAPRKITVRDE